MSWLWVIWLNSFCTKFTYSLVIGHLGVCWCDYIDNPDSLLRVDWVRPHCFVVHRYPYCCECRAPGYRHREDPRTGRV